MTQDGASPTSSARLSPLWNQARSRAVSHRQVDGLLRGGVEPAQVGGAEAERPHRPGAGHRGVDAAGARRPSAARSAAKIGPRAAQVAPGGRPSGRGTASSPATASRQSRAPRPTTVRPMTRAETSISGSATRIASDTASTSPHDPGHEVAGAAPLDVGEGHGERPVDDLLAQARRGSARPARRPAARPDAGEDALGERGDGQRDDRAVEVAGRPAADDDVDQRAEQPGHGQERPRWPPPARRRRRPPAPRSSARGGADRGPGLRGRWRRAAPPAAGRWPASGPATVGPGPVAAGGGHASTAVAVAGVAGARLGVVALGDDPAAVHQRPPGRRRPAAWGWSVTTTVVRPARSARMPGGDAVLGGGVDRGGRLVEHQHRGVGGERPGEGHPLALAARQPAARLAEGARSALRQAVGRPRRPSAAASGGASRPARPTWRRRGGSAGDLGGQRPSNSGASWWATITARRAAARSRPAWSRAVDGDGARVGVGRCGRGRRPGRRRRPGGGDDADDLAGGDVEVEPGERAVAQVPDGRARLRAPSAVAAAPAAGTGGRVRRGRRRGARRPTPGPGRAPRRSAPAGRAGRAGTG